MGWTVVSNGLEKVSNGLDDFAYCIRSIKTTIKQRATREQKNRGSGLWITPRFSLNPPISDSLDMKRNTKYNLKTHGVQMLKISVPPFVLLAASLSTACSSFQRKDSPEPLTNVACTGTPQWTTQDVDGNPVEIYVCFGPNNRLLYNPVVSPVSPTAQRPRRIDETTTTAGPQ